MTPTSGKLKNYFTPYLWVCVFFVTFAALLLAFLAGVYKHPICHSFFWSVTDVDMYDVDLSSWRVLIP